MSCTQFLKRSAMTTIMVISLLAFAQVASAETMRVNTTTKLRAQPGEAAKVLKTLKPNQKVVVLRKKGRWLRVRIGKRTGWVTQTTVEPLKGNQARDSDGKWSDKNKKNKKKSRQASASSEAKRYVAIKRKTASARREPQKSSREVFLMQRGDIASVEGRSDDRKWLLVQNEDGQLGWVRKRRVETVTDLDEVRSRRPPGSTDPTDPVDVGPVRSVRKNRLVVPRLEASLGFRGLSMNFTSNGTALLDQYVIQASSALTQVGVSIPFTFGDFLLELGGAYAFSISRPGIRLPDNMGEISYLTHDAQLGAQLGYRFMEGQLTVAGSGGYHYSVFRPDQVGPPVYLPSEQLVGITAGGIVEYAPGAANLTIRGGFHTLIGGVRSQTLGLEDGEISVAGAWWGHVDVDYALLKTFDLVAGYTLERASTQWVGTSKRRPGVTEATRIDTNHLLYFGLGRAF